MQVLHLRSKGVAVLLRGITTRRASTKVIVPKALSPSPSATSSTALLLEGRRATEDMVPVEAFAIAGVTFAGRQDLVRKLQRDQIVYLEREPWNQYDLFAVRVLDLHGRVLGYIPRRDGQNARFMYEGAFGLVASTGLVKDTAFYGARLYARPKLASLLLDPLMLPGTAATCLADLRVMFGERWAPIRATTLAAANYRCEVTWVSQNHLPIEITPQWCYNAKEKAVQLTRLIALSKPVAALKARLEQAIAEIADENDTTTAAALEALQATPDGQLFTELNGIAKEDVIQYFELIRRRARTIQVDQWRIELLL
ncbi:hypothetical protein Vretimale_17512 [Volvox reticuliferus]|uniref:HIRAN domain-containing protein n=2 Tax=Volvox reticuliferus TaxID=1737510 RepID=A0A8J4GWM0_9CHLO|nr:hypothetical protein Vretimale_17512 [Volvox reticuliferus]